MIGDDDGLAGYFGAHVQGGAGSFVLEVREPAALVDAMVEKLLRDLIAERHPVITAAMPSPPSGAWAE